MRFQTAFALPLILAAAACGSNDAPPPAAEATAEPAQSGDDPGPTEASATLKTADGKDAGTVSLLATGEGINLVARVVGLAAGTHGIHVHTLGACDGPKFESAGAHWNPTDKQHGFENPAGPHAGDMPNLRVGDDGGGIARAALAGAKIAELLDADGAAVVVHAKPDDQKTDPSGDSGDRIACGVLDAS